MALGILYTAAACVAMWAAGQGERIEARLKVKYSGAERLAAALKASTLGTVPADIADVKVDPERNELVVKGKTESVEELREVVRLLDVSPMRLRIKAQIYRLRPGSKPARELLSETVSITANNTPMAITVGDEIWDQTATILPRINGDGSISLRIDFAFAVSGEIQKTPKPFLRRVGVGQQFASEYTDDPRAWSGNPGGFEMRVGLGRPQYRIELKVLDILPAPARQDTKQ